jgi:hypothetical protein
MAMEEGSDDYGRSQLKLKEALIKNHAYLVLIKSFIHCPI